MLLGNAQSFKTGNKMSFELKRLLNEDVCKIKMLHENQRVNHYFVFSKIAPGANEKTYSFSF